MGLGAPGGTGPGEGGIGGVPGGIGAVGPGVAGIDGLGPGDAEAIAAAIAKGASLGSIIAGLPGLGFGAIFGGMSALAQGDPTSGRGGVTGPDSVGGVGGGPDSQTILEVKKALVKPKAPLLVPEEPVINRDLNRRRVGRQETILTAGGALADASTLKPTLLGN